MKLVPSSLVLLSITISFLLSFQYPSSVDARPPDLFPQKPSCSGPGLIPAPAVGSRLGHKSEPLNPYLESVQKVHSLQEAGGVCCRDEGDGAT